MTAFIKDPLLQERNILFAWLETTYRDLHCLDTERFYRTADETIEQLREQYSDYDRRTVFSQDPYFRFFRKFKKTCPVMLQFESVLRGRPFPHRNPAAEVPFLFEIRTRMLSGTHDLDCVRGDLRICSAQERETFTGLRGEEVHCYPGDIIGRDDEGIILSMISGADARTCCHDHSTHVFYPVFGTPDMPEETLRDALDLLEQYVHLLDQEARTAKHIL